jgi:hypothetical protein
MQNFLSRMTAAFYIIGQNWGTEDLDHASNDVLHAPGFMC